MKNLLGIILITFLTCPLFAVNPAGKIGSEIFETLIVKGQSKVVSNTGKSNIEVLIKNKIPHAYQKECLAMCKRYPDAQNIILKNADYFVPLSREIGDDFLKHEVLSPGIARLCEGIIGRDGLKLLAKESPQDFLNTVRYLYKNPSSAKAYIATYKFCDKLLTPKNILATSVGLGAFKICYDVGTSIKEVTEKTLDVMTDFARENPFTAFVTITMAIMALVCLIFGVIKKILKKLFVQTGAFWGKFFGKKKHLKNESSNTANV